MLTIRLTRVGKKKQPSYRMVVQEKSKDPWGSHVDIVGFYNPLANPKVLTIKNEKVLDWISKGAQPSPTVHNLLVQAGVVQAEKKNNTTGDKKRMIEAKKAAETAKAEEAAKKAEEEKAAEEQPAEAEAAAEEQPAEEAK